MQSPIPSTQTQFSRKIFLIVFVLVVIVAFGTSVLAWTAPTQTPPNGNVLPPLNVGPTSQVKPGGLWALSFGSDSGYCIGGACISSWPTSQWTLAGTNLYYTGGNVGIGVSSPVATLDVNSYARMTPQTSAPVACDATNKGSIAIADSSSHVCVCDGTSWVFNYNSAACAWTADIVAPTVSITAPAGGATVSSVNVTVSANASDNVGVAGVQFKLDGANLGSEDTTSPYSITWDTTVVANGSHTITAVARDAGGNTTTSTGVSVTVSNTPTVIFLTSGTSWTVPANWNSGNNKIEVIGGGGGGGGATIYAGSGGGGGGAYSKITNLSLTSGAAITVQIGAAGTGGSTGTAGGDTYFNGASCAGASVCAKGGAGGTQGSTSGIGGAGGAGGASGSGVGSTKYSGGNGGSGGANDYGGGGGGGAAGFTGNGANGGGANSRFGGGGGGGGSNNGTIGATPNDNPGGPGGAGGVGGMSGSMGGAAGAINAVGTAGTKGGGGGGSGTGTTLTAAAGGTGQDWDSTHGSGGGGGAGSNSAGPGGAAGAGGGYGGGGGGGGDVTSGGAGGSGAQGIIVITYVP